MRHALWVFIPVLTWLLAGGAHAQSRDRNWSLCTGDVDDDNRIIAGCTAIIQSRNETEANRAIAFSDAPAVIRGRVASERAALNRYVGQK